MKSIFNYLTRVLAISLALLSAPYITYGQDIYNYKDKTFKFEVNFPDKPHSESGKSYLKEISYSKSSSLAFSVFVYSAEVKLNGKKVLESADERFTALKASGNYVINDTRKFTSGGVNVIEFSGKLAKSNYNILYRTFVYGKFYYRFAVISGAEISKNFSYPFLNSIKVNNIAIQDPDTDASQFQKFVFEETK